MRDEGRPINLPEITEAINLKQWVEELGFCESGMNGPTQLTHKEIESWANLTGIELTPTDALMLRHLSNEFVSQYFKSDEKCLAPYTISADEDEVAQGALFLSILDSIGKQKPA